MRKNCSEEANAYLKIMCVCCVCRSTSGGQVGEGVSGVCLASSLSFFFSLTLSFSFALSFSLALSLDWRLYTFFLFSYSPLYLSPSPFFFFTFSTPTKVPSDIFHLQPQPQLWCRTGSPTLSCDWQPERCCRGAQGAGGGCVWGLGCLNDNEPFFFLFFPLPLTNKKRSVRPHPVSITMFGGFFKDGPACMKWFVSMKKKAFKIEILGIKEAKDATFRNIRFLFFFFVKCACTLHGRAYTVAELRWLSWGLE